jgi:hypothetical protein
VELNGRRGFVGMEPTRPSEYTTIAEIEVPNAPEYVLVDFDPGVEFFDVTPDDALPQILGRGRSPLTIDEGIAVLTQFPHVLEETAFSLARIPARRPACTRALDQRRQASPGLVLGRSAALVAWLGLVRGACAGALGNVLEGGLAAAFLRSVRPRA